MLVTLLLYNGVEPIDLASIGVISMAKRVIPKLRYETVSADRSPVELENGLSILATRTFDELATTDVLIVPGGPGWRRASKDEPTLALIRRLAPTSIICSVCTGAMVLAEAGVLNGLPATTKSEVVAPESSPLQELSDRYPLVEARRALVVDGGNVITGGGVSLCIDTVLYLLERTFGAAKANEVSRIIEYSSSWSANRERFSGSELGRATSA